MKNFPNGITAYLETFYEIVSFIEGQLVSYEDYRDYNNEVFEREDAHGKGGLYELAEDWTDEFERLNEGRKWDGEFFDEIEEFCILKNKGNGDNFEE